MSTEQLVYRGDLKGHQGWVTAIAAHPNNSDVVISASRDKSIIVWKVSQDQSTSTYAVPVKRFTGHNHFIQDLAITIDNKGRLFFLTASWDGSVALWSYETGRCQMRFVGHTKDVLSVAITRDNRYIVSGSRDNTIKVWIATGECRSTLGQNQDGHSNWVSCVRFSPAPQANDSIITTFVSAGWDKLVKVWVGEQKDKVEFKNKYNLRGHTANVNSVIVSPDGSLCASGGKDGVAMLWDIVEGRHLYSLEAGEAINTLIFSPVRYWLCAATASSIIIWDLESKVCLDTVKITETLGKKTLPTQCLSLSWSNDGNVLYAGYSDNVIRAYVVSQAK